MSLTSHLKEPTSPIGQFIKQRFNHTAHLAKVANAQLIEQSTIHPTLADTPYPYSTIGMAIDYRIRYAFAITPNRQLAAWKGAAHLNPKLWEINDNNLQDQVEYATRLEQRVESTQKTRFLERLRTFLRENKPQQKKEPQRPYSAQLLLAFFNSLDRTVTAIQPAGRYIDDEEAELTLARYCYLLALFEEAYRSNAYILGPLINPEPKRTLDELLSIPKEDWLEDICLMFAAFYRRYSSLLSLPYILNPEFQGSKDVGNADADLIVDGCLIDIKASIRPKVEPMYLRQLVGYLLLDYDDMLHIDSVGIYMARQGMLLKWGVPEFFQKLTGDSHASLISLRHEFQALCQETQRGTVVDPKTWRLFRPQVSRCSAIH